MHGHHHIAQEKEIRQDVAPVCPSDEDLKLAKKDVLVRKQNQWAEHTLHRTRDNLSTE